MRKVLFELVRRPTNEEAGITSVKLGQRDNDTDEFDASTTMGEIHRTRGSNEFKAFAHIDGADELTEIGVFPTRSKAGHAVERSYLLTERQEAEHQREAAKAEGGTPTKVPGRGRGRPRKTPDAPPKASTKAGPKPAEGSPRLTVVPSITQEMLDQLPASMQVEAIVSRAGAAVAQAAMRVAAVRAVEFVAAVQAAQEVVDKLHLLDEPKS